MIAKYFRFNGVITVNIFVYMVLRTTLANWTWVTSFVWTPNIGMRIPQSSKGPSIMTFSGGYK